jgi:uncharacterized protein (DUF1697 family)
MRSVAFLRGVSPQNLRMADLRACLEDAGSTEVRTLSRAGTWLSPLARALSARWNVGWRRRLKRASGARSA